MLKGVDINKGEPPNWRVLMFRLLGKAAWLTPKNKPPPHICYHVKFGRSASKGVHINRREPPKLGSIGASPLAMVAWLTP